VVPASPCRKTRVAYRHGGGYIRTRTVLPNPGASVGKAIEWKGQLAPRRYQTAEGATKPQAVDGALFDVGRQNCEKVTGSGWCAGYGRGTAALVRAARKTNHPPPPTQKPCRRQYFPASGSMRLGFAEFA